MSTRVAGLLLTYILIACPVGTALAAPADPAIVQSWVDRAVAATNRIPDPEQRSFAHYHLARVLGKHGDAKQALASAKQVDDLRQLYALKYVAEAARKAGNEELCREVVAVGEPTALKDPGAFIDTAYIDVCFAAGLPEAALKVAGNTHGNYLKIVEAFCATGNCAAAERLVKEKNLGEQGRLNMALGSVEANDIQAALEIIESLPNADLADRGYVAVATALAHTGDNERAKKYVALIQNEETRRRTAGEIARFYTKDDSREELRREFATADSREAKSGILLFLVRKLCEAHQFAEADYAIDEAASAIASDPQPDASSKFGTYGDKSATAWVRGLHLEIARSMIEQGKHEQAAEQVAKLAAALDEVPPEAAIVRWPLEAALVEALLKLDREDDAISRTNNMSGPSHARATAAIAVHRIDAGRIDEGLQIAEDIAVNRSEGSEKGDVALALLRAAGPERAATYLNQLQTSERGSSAYAQVARKLTEAGNLDHLEAIYIALESPVAEAHYAMEVATRLMLTE